MGNILVCGNSNLETTLRVEDFPLEYAPVHYRFHGIHSQVSGVGFNIATALATLGDRVRFASLVGRDPAAALVESALETRGIGREFLVAQMAETPHSVVIVDRAGQRQVNTDLKDLPEQVYPPELIESALRDCSLAVLTNVNYARPFLHRAGRAGALVATDLHAIADLDDAHNREFLESAQILFMSHERLPRSPEEWVQRLLERYGAQIVVVGLGERGALLGVRRDGYLGLLPAVRTREVVNTVGAGDALLAAFVHAYSKAADPYEALARALVFASYKIGEDGGSRGFLSESALERLYADTQGEA
jgi:sugar/nucleoside kinase (ribokinase family)